MPFISIDFYTRIIWKNIKNQVVYIYIYTYAQEDEQLNREIKHTYIVAKNILMRILYVSKHLSHPQSMECGDIDCELAIS